MPNNRYQKYGVPKKEDWGTIKRNIKAEERGWGEYRKSRSSTKEYWWIK
jgi:hypothetical protein